MSIHSASIPAQLSTQDGICVLTDSPLDISSIIDSVGSDEAGAKAVFIGTTRNSFRGKTVTRLEYQAYSKLAIKTMADILCVARSSNSLHSSESSAPQPTHNLDTPPIIRCAVYHRLGTVPVGEASIVIAVSSPHRNEAFHACEFILEGVKSKAQIWKREYYEGEREEDAEWKANYAP